MKSPAESLIDVLTELMHFAAENLTGVNFDWCLMWARQHYAVEYSLKLDQKKKRKRGVLK